MKSGILQPDEGYMLVVDGVNRSFRDVEATAYGSAAYLKALNPHAVVQVRHLEDGRLVTVEADGRRTIPA
jgi:hypothetical protein